MITDDKIRDEKLQYDINQDAVKISALSSKRIDKYEYLTGEEILLSNQRRVIKQTKFAYSPLGKAFEKQTKTIENKGEKQLKAIEDHGKQLVESNELIKNNSNIETDSIPFEELKKKKNELVKGRSSGFWNLEKIINPDSLICKYKTEGISRKDFRNYQNPTELFKDLRGGGINRKDVFKRWN